MLGKWGTEIGPPCLVKGRKKLPYSVIRKTKGEGIFLPLVSGKPAEKQRKKERREKRGRREEEERKKGRKKKENSRVLHPKVPSFSCMVSFGCFKSWLA